MAEKDSSITYHDLLQGKRPDPADEGLIARANTSQRAILALGFALMDLPERAESLIKTIEDRSADEETQGIILEAKSVHAASQSAPDEVVERFAEAAVESRPTAVFGLRLLGRIAEFRKEKDAAARLYERAWQVYPESERTLFDLIRALMSLRKRREASQFLRRARPSLRKEIYRFALHRRSWYGIGLSVVLTLAILGATTFPASMLLGVGVGSLVLVYGFCNRDGIALSVGVWLEILVWAAFGLRILLSTVS